MTYCSVRLISDVNKNWLNMYDYNIDTQYKDGFNFSEGVGLIYSLLREDQLHLMFWEFLFIYLACECIVYCHIIGL